MQNKKLQFNYAAVNGAWNVYPLVVATPSNDNNKPVVVAWFVAAVAGADGINPLKEAQRILQVANSPYEQDNGTNCNDEENFDSRVMVINRYDWTHFDDRGAVGEHGDCVENSNENYGVYANYISLVDYEQASRPQEDWYQQQHGFRAVLDGEYSFGRFGLTEDRSQVHSFLFFAANTELSRACFITTLREDNDASTTSSATTALSPCIYTPLTPEQLHARQLADPEQYCSGFTFLRSISLRKPPAAGSLLGPFGASLFSLEQLQAIQKGISSCPRFERQLEGAVLELLNELCCSWLFVLSGQALEYSASWDNFIEHAFSKRNQNKSIDSYLMTRMTATPIQVEEEAKVFELNEDAMRAVIDPTRKLYTYFTRQQLGAGIRYLLSEVLELAGNCARDNKRQVVFPYDIRLAVSNDQELNDALGKAKLFYPPDMWEGSLASE